MPTIQEMQADMHAAQAHGDTAMAQHIGQLIQQAQSQQNNPVNGLNDLGPLGNALQAGVVNAAHQVPLIGDAAMTAGRWAGDTLRGQNTSWQRANDEVHQILQSAQQTHPVSSLVGGGAGAVLSAAAGGAALKAASAGEPVLGTALAARTGQPIANVARTAVAAGLAGAAQGSAQGGGEQLAAGHPDAAPAAALRGGGGGFAGGLVAGGAGGAVGGRIAGAAANLDSKAALALAKVFGENPADLQAAWAAFKADTGRAPTMAEMATFKQRGLISDAAKNSAPISSALRDADNAQAVARSNAMQQQVAQLPGDAGPVAPQASAEAANATTARGDVDYPDARKLDFKVSMEDGQEGDGFDGLSPADHLASKIVPLAGLKSADRVRIVEALQKGNLSGEDAQMLRAKLGRAQGQGSNYSPAISTAQEDLEDLLGGQGNEQANAALAKANQNYAAGAQRAAGVAQGEGILNNSESPANFAAEAARKPNAGGTFAGSVSSGAKSDLMRASGTVQGADSLAQRFATDSNLYSKMATSFGKSGADALQRMGKAESAASENLSSLSNRLPPSQDKDLKDTVNTFAHAAATIGSHGMFYKALHATRLVTGGGMSDAVQNKVAQYLADPNMTVQGINLLSKAGVPSAAVRRWVMGAAATVGGLTSSATEQ